MEVSFQQWGNSTAQNQILMIHGWGMNSGVWTDIAKRLLLLYPNTMIRCVDLPGYGRSASIDSKALGGSYSASNLAKSLTPLLDEKQTIVIAWSMGGLVAIDLLSDHNEKLTQLILVSSTPRFIRGDGWQNAVEACVFEEFSQSLTEDHQATLRRFLAIQALGSRTAREDIKTLQSHLFDRGMPDPNALKDGLQLLLKEDKRRQLMQKTDIPISLISGKLDTLVDYQGQKLLAEQDHISLFTLSAAGHAPFISHPEEFTRILQEII